MKTVMNKNKIQAITIGALVTATLVSGAFLSSARVSADNDNSVDEINITVPVSCTMSGTGQNSHNAEIVNGTYTADIGTTTLKAFCNDSEGFAIYAIGYTGDEYGATDLVGASTGNTIATGTATSAGNPDVSNWAMKLTAVSSPTPTYPITIAGSSSDSEKEQGDPDFSGYTAVPSSYSKVAYRNSGTDIGLSAEGSALTTTYAAYISKTQAADTYSGKVKYTLVHPSTEEPLQPQTATSGCINYFANASTAVGTMGCQPIESTDTSATLLASNFSREGYGFAGWSDAFDYATNPNAHFYGPQEDITFTRGQYTGTNNGLALYAVWIPSAGSLQDSAKVAELCGTGTGSLTTAPTDGTANLSSVSALTDARDNETYAIAKLADGNCWMIENLRLESTNSDNSTGALAQGYGTSASWGNFGGLADAEALWANNSAAANSLYSTDGANDTINIGTSNGTANAAYRFPRYINWNNQSTSANRPQNPTTNDAINNISNASIYSYGNYYTWPAAIADTTFYYNGGDYNTTSICPKGWQIPLGNTSTGDIAQGEADAANKVGGFSYLDRKMGGTGKFQSATAASLRWRKYPVNFVYSGTVSSGSLGDRGNSGSYWSSTASFYSNAYELDLYSYAVAPGTGNYNRYRGNTIRCLVTPGS